MPPLAAFAHHGEHIALDCIGGQAGQFGDAKPRMGQDPKHVAQLAVGQGQDLAVLGQGQEAAVWRILTEHRHGGRRVGDLIAPGGPLAVALDGGQVAVDRPVREPHAVEVVTDVPAGDLAHGQHRRRQGGQESVDDVRVQAPGTLRAGLLQGDLPPGDRGAQGFHRLGAGCSGQGDLGLGHLRKLVGVGLGIETS